MSAEFKNDQLLFNADIYDQQHKLAARIENNEFHLVKEKIAYPKRPDRSTLEVYDEEGELLLALHYRNKDAIDVRGTFRCADGKLAKVDKDGELTMRGPKRTFRWDKGCLINTGGFVVGEYGFGVGQTPAWACDPQFPLCQRQREKERERALKKKRENPP
jgi:hypothetical protein